VTTLVFINNKIPTNDDDTGRDEKKKILGNEI